MKYSSSLIGLALITLMGCSPSLEGDLIISDVNIIDVKNNRVIPNQDVVIYNGTIKEILPTGKRLKAENIVEGRDKFLIPGLFDMHTHLTMSARYFEQMNGSLKGRIVYNREIGEWVAHKMLNYGVTTVREAGGFLKDAIELRNDINNGNIQGPRIFVCGPLIEGDPSYHSGMAVRITDVEQAKNEVRAQVTEGADFIKVYATLQPDLTKAVIEEAHAQGVRVLAHLGATSWDEGVEFGVDDIIHTQHPTSGYTFFKDIDSDSTVELLSKTASFNVANTPSLVIARYFLADSTIFEKDYLKAINEMPALILDSWDQQQDFLLSFWLQRFGNRDLMNQELEERYGFARDLTTTTIKSGVTVLPGTDCCNMNIVPGLSLHKELALLVKTGFSPAEVLQLATLTSAEWLGISQKVGVIDEGMIADLIIVEANPLEDIRNTEKIQFVIQNGNIIKRY